MVAWAIQAGIASDGEQAGPTLVVDNGVFDNRRGFQVWVYHGGPGAAVEMYAGKEKIGEVAAEKQYDKAAMSRAAFINPRHGNESEVPDEVHFALKGHPDVQTRPIVVVDDYRELDFVAQDQPFLQQLAGEAGGMYRPFVDIEDFFQQIEGKARTEEYVSRWRLWDSTTILVLMAALLTAGWIWRKLVGLV